MSESFDRSPSTTSDEQILLAAMSGFPREWEQLTKRFDPYLRAVARRRLPDMPSDIRNEFIQEVWMRVAAQAPEHFVRAGTSAKKYIGQFVSPAVNAVRANYRAPGQKSRHRVAVEPVALHSIVLLPDAAAARYFERAAARADLERLLSVAEPKLLRGALFVVRTGGTLTEAASHAGMPRETFRRKLLALPQQRIVVRSSRLSLGD